MWLVPLANGSPYWFTRVRAINLHHSSEADPNSDVAPKLWEVRRWSAPKFSREGDSDVVVRVVVSKVNRGASKRF
jgi:hypothetical protein